MRARGAVGVPRGFGLGALGLGEDTGGQEQGRCHRGWDTLGGDHLETEEMVRDRDLTSTNTDPSLCKTTPALCYSPLSQIYIYILLPGTSEQRCLQSSCQPNCPETWL